MLNPNRNPPARKKRKIWKSRKKRNQKRRKKKKRNTKRRRKRRRVVRIARAVIKDMINLETVLNSLILNQETSSPMVTHTGRRMKVEVNSGEKINPGLDLPIGENGPEAGLR